MTRWTGVFVVVLALAHGACNTGSEPRPGNEVSSSRPSASNDGRASANSDFPTAPVCIPAVSGEMVTITLGVDAPSPRCANVKGSQTLEIQNDTDQQGTVTIGGRQVQVGPHERVAVGGQTGSYLQDGVHRISVSLYGDGGGAEIVVVR